MQITKLRLQNFRNHIDTEVSWAPHMNVIVGQNGSGKTNLIDAIHYLCMSCIFVSTSDRYVVNHDETFFMLEGYFEGNNGLICDVGCSASGDEGKKTFVNASPLARLSDLICRVPVLVLKPG